MGEVYLAQDPALGREVALKVITPPDGAAQDKWRRRFTHEVQAAGRLNHPHIVTIYDVDLNHEPPYVVMERLAGDTLKTRLASRSLAWLPAVQLILPAGQALAYAHRAGIVHRDIKPGNIMFSQGDPTDPVETWPRYLKLVDFGLAFSQDRERITETGGVVGTPAYMSPEQANGDIVDARTDIFALGLILLEMMTGHNPQDKGSLGQTWLAATSYEPIDLTNLRQAQAPEALIAVVEQALAKNREQRYHSCEVLLRDLQACLSETSMLVPAAASTQTIPPGRLEAGPTVENPKGLNLPPNAEAILRQMFQGYLRVVLRDEFSAGLSGSRVFLVRPIRQETPELPVVVKMAPVPLIEQEWRAYQRCIHDKMPGVAEIKGEPVLPPGSDWGGLRYPLVGGGGVFETESLASYYRRASAEDIRYVVESRLFKSLGPRWFFNQPRPEFPLRASYDPILPVNLLIKPAAPPPETRPRLLKPGNLNDRGLAAGTPIRLEGFVITEVDPAAQSVTLDLPAGENGTPQAYRLRLQPVENLEAYQVNNLIDPVEGVITATRLDLLRSAAQQALGLNIDLTAEYLELARSHFTDSAPRTTPPLPNPLLTLPNLLRESRDVKTACIHGDLNLQNILVDPATRDVSLIDFARARQDHVLHDLLRLETEVITHLLPEALAGAELPVETICELYGQLHCTVVEREALGLNVSPSLVKIWMMLLAIRQAAKNYLFQPADWSEYYQGLILYLLGSLKFENLDRAPTAPLPKQAAFWGAATIQQLLQAPSPCADLLAKPQAVAGARRSAWIVAGVMLLLVVGLAAGLFLWSGSDLESSPAPAPLAALVSFKPEVEVKRAGSDRLIPAAFGMPLGQADVVNTYAGAAANLVCNNGLLYALPEQSNLIVECRDTTDERIVGRLDPALGGQLLEVAGGAEISLAAGQTRAIRPEQAQIPLLLTPRNTVITGTQPIFRWQAVPEATGYRLTVSLPGGQTWSQETEATELAYPDDAPPLEPGSANVVTLAMLDDETIVDKTLLRIIEEAEQEALVQAKAEIQAQPLDETTRCYLLVQLYQSSELYAAAIEQLSYLVEIEPDNSSLWQQLGDLYFEIGLYIRAEVAYQSALRIAETAGTLGEQAAAQVGLARVAHAFAEVEQAAAHLDAAENLYREAGEAELAQKVAAERARLE